MKTLLELASKMHEPTVEIRYPNPALRNSQEIEYVHHRFAVRGGISPAELTQRFAGYFSAPNALFSSLVFKRAADA
jgi:hypothetical protein